MFKTTIMKLIFAIFLITVICFISVKAYSLISDSKCGEFDPKCLLKKYSKNECPKINHFTAGQKNDEVSNCIFYYNNNGVASIIAVFDEEGMNRLIGANDCTKNSSEISCGTYSVFSNHEVKYFNRLFEEKEETED